MKDAPKQNGANTTGSKENRGSKTIRKTAGRDRLGIETEGLLIVGEDASEFEEFAAKIIEERNPVGPVEQELVERVVSLLWRQKRIPRLEAAVIAARDAATVMNSPVQQKKVRRDHLYAMAARFAPKSKQNGDAQGDTDPGSDAAQEEAEQENACPDPDEAIGRALIHDVENGNVLGQLLRHEAWLNSTLARTLNMLRRRQADRKAAELSGNRTPS